MSLGAFLSRIGKGDYAGHPFRGNQHVKRPSRAAEELAGFAVRMAQTFEENRRNLNPDEMTTGELRRQFENIRHDTEKLIEYQGRSEARSVPVVIEAKEAALRLLDDVRAPLRERERANREAARQYRENPTISEWVEDHLRTVSRVERIQGDYSDGWAFRNAGSQAQTFDQLVEIAEMRHIKGTFGYDSAMLKRLTSSEDKFRKKNDLQDLATIEPFEARHQARLQWEKGFAEARKKDFDRFVRDQETALRTVARNSDVFVQFNEEGLLGFLRSGTFRTLHEAAGESNSISTRHHDAAAGQTDRLRIEHMLYGLPDTGYAQDRPVSGYLWDKGSSGAHYPERDHVGMRGTASISLGDPMASVVANYGDIAVRLKRNVRERTQMVVGDSFAEGSNLIAAPSPVNRPKVESAGIHVLIGSKKPSEVQAPYIEAVIHNGLKVEDIDTVYFNYDPEPRVKKALDDAGVKWVQRFGRTGYTQQIAEVELDHYPWLDHTLVDTPDPQFAKGDYSGHPFRGNQYVSGKGSSAPKLTQQALDRHEPGPKEKLNGIRSVADDVWQRTFIGCEAIRDEADHIVAGNLRDERGYTDHVALAASLLQRVNDAPPRTEFHHLQEGYEGAGRPSSHLFRGMAEWEEGHPIVSELRRIKESGETWDFSIASFATQGEITHQFMENTDSFGHKGPNLGRIQIVTRGPVKATPVINVQDNRGGLDGPIIWDEKNAEGRPYAEVPIRTEEWVTGGKWRVVEINERSALTEVIIEQVETYDV